jgi:hypothetical protein
MEVSDYQMAAALLSMPVVIQSHKFAFVDPYSTLAYMKDHTQQEDNSDAPLN